MNSNSELQQLLLLRTNKGTEIVARSDGIGFEQEEFARRTAIAYGDRPEGFPTFQAVFALPHNTSTIAVGTVHAPDQPASVPLAFRFLFVPRPVYLRSGNPFALADQHQLSTQSRGRLPSLPCDCPPDPQRLVADLQNLLKHGDGPLLLGGTQALLDGTRIRLTAPEPDRTLRDIWQLLPNSCRNELWPCEFCFADELPFHAAVLPALADKQPSGTIRDDQVRDYPAGRYEMALQLAVETGDQSEVNRLLARQSPREVLRMALWLLFFAAAVAIALRLMRD